MRFNTFCTHIHASKCVFHLFLWILISFCACSRLFIFGKSWNQLFLIQWTSYHIYICIYIYIYICIFVYQPHIGGRTWDRVQLHALTVCMLSAGSGRHLMASTAAGGTAAGAAAAVAAAVAAAMRIMASVRLSWNAVTQNLHSQLLPSMLSSIHSWSSPGADAWHQCGCCECGFLVTAFHEGLHNGSLFIWKIQAETTYWIATWCGRLFGEGRPKAARQYVVSPCICSF